MGSSINKPAETNSTNVNEKLVPMFAHVVIDRGSVNPANPFGTNTKYQVPTPSSSLGGRLCGGICDLGNKTNSTANTFYFGKKNPKGVYHLFYTGLYTTAGNFPNPYTITTSQSKSVKYISNLSSESRVTGTEITTLTANFFIYVDNPEGATVTFVTPGVECTVGGGVAGNCTHADLFIYYLGEQETEINAI
jgi:hypothetical protein